MPIKLHSKLLDTLNKLQELKVISKVNEARDWIHSLVLVEKKDGTLRLCLDPRNLNKFIKKQPCLIPTLEEITLKVNNAKHFSVLDLKDGFWHIILDKESQKLCTFSTPFGNYQFNRLPFGVSSAPEIFQCYNQQVFGDINNVMIYLDDILVEGKTQEEHNEALNNVIERAKQFNIKFNESKFQYNVSEVKYLGHIFSDKGILPCKDRVEAIQELQNPNSKKELQKFLGIINYVRNFVPCFAEVTAPLRELLKKDVVFQWSDKHSNAVNKVKELLVSPPILASFDSNKELTIQCDASQNGLGACLMQVGTPIAFSSRSLSETEKRYSQIEKEFLAITYACKKYHNYIYGQKVSVMTDHKPIISVFQKDIHKVASAKLQRMRIRMLNYDVNVEYLPGKYMHIADYLSRHFREVGDSEEDSTFFETVLSINMSNEKHEIFEKELLKDETLKIVANFCKNGWPVHKSKVLDSVKIFYKNKNEIILENNILFLGDRIIVPKSLKNAMMAQLHEPHMGITKTKRRAKELFYWPLMDSDIENFISKCQICLHFSNSNVKEPLISHYIPKIPFIKVGCDILQFKNKSYLICVDYYSKWFEYKLLKNKSSQEVINKWMEIFSTYGIPQIVIADNVPFNSFECRNFAKNWGLDIVTSSPHYPRSNGLAEKYVGIFKNILKKCETEEKIRLSILEYRNTPTQDLEFSPSQLLCNRRLRTKLPIKNILLHPKLNKDVNKQFNNKSQRSRQFYNRSCKQQRPFYVGEKIFIQDYLNGKWVNGSISAITNTPRSYMVKDDFGRVYRRNSIHLKHYDKNQRDSSNSATS